jgi:hypothetical protein
MLGPELLPSWLCRRRCRMEGIDDAMQPIPVSIFEHRTVCATQTVYVLGNKTNTEEKQRLTLQINPALELVDIGYAQDCYY